jgi:hypothetical protein
MSKVQKSQRDVDIVTEIKLHLDVYKERIASEIRQYPMPIPGCDAQYNFLLKERAGVNRELKELELLAKRALSEIEFAGTLREFINASEHIQAEKSRELMASLP